MTHSILKNTAGVILAGGLATRMGGIDKALLRLGDTTLLELVIERLAPQCRALAINANGNANRFSAFGLPVIPDTLPGHQGPLAGILAGLDWGAEIGVDTIVTVATDTPFLPHDLVVKLADASTHAAVPVALAASPDGTGTMRAHPTFGLWPVELREELRKSLHSGTRKVSQWAHRHGATLAEFDSSPFDPFININTPEDLAAARSLLAR